MGTPPLKLQHWSMSDARNFCVSHDNIFCVLGLRSYVMYSCASQSVPWASRKDSALSYQMTDAVCSGLNAIYIFCVRSWFWTALAEFWDNHVDTGAAIMNHLDVNFRLLQHGFLCHLGDTIRREFLRRIIENWARSNSGFFAISNFTKLLHLKTLGVSGSEKFQI